MLNNLDVDHSGELFLPRDSKLWETWEQLLSFFFVFFFGLATCLITCLKLSWENCNNWWQGRKKQKNKTDPNCRKGKEKQGIVNKWAEFPSWGKFVNFVTSHLVCISFRRNLLLEAKRLCCSSSAYIGWTKARATQR